MKMTTLDNDLKLQIICECLKKEALAIGVIQERAIQIPQTFQDQSSYSY